LEDQKLMQV